MSKPIIPCAVEGVSNFQPRQVGLLVEDGGYHIHLIIPEEAADDLAVALGKKPVNRWRSRRACLPDLCQAIMNQSGSRVGCCVIDGIHWNRLNDDVWPQFFATLHVSSNGQTQKHICLMEDGLNLAVRFQAAVFITPEVLEGRGKPPEGTRIRQLPSFV